MRFSIIIILLAIISASNLFSQKTQYVSESELSDSIYRDAQVYKINDTVSYLYTKPVHFSFVKNSVLDIYYGTKNVFRKESIWPVVGITASSLLLITFDDRITNAAQRFGNYIGLPGDNHAKNISPIKGVSFYVPTDLSSGLYYIGDGITEMAVNSGFYIYGLAKHDYRALKTASELSEGLICIGITVQILKHATGREDPFHSPTTPGRWRWFPSIKEYQNHVPHYDAFPSGHLATAMMTTTIISTNYPEKTWIKPLCYTLMGLCGYQMLNNGVHWAGDYPLALAIGYSFGKIAVARGRMQIVKNNTTMTENGYLYHKESFIKSFNVRPAYLGFGATGLNVSIGF